jgi:hypothetical protein
MPGCAAGQIFFGLGWSLLFSSVVVQFNDN